VSRVTSMDMDITWVAFFTLFSGDENIVLRVKLMENSKRKLIFPSKSILGKILVLGWFLHYFFN